jgi:hypothetical protein
MSSSTRNGLECRLGLGRIALPAESVDLFGEYTVGARLPFNDRVGFAIGVWEGQPIVSVTIGQHDSAPARPTRGALLVTPGASIRWAFEIDQPMGLVRIANIAAGNSAVAWRRAATLVDGRGVQYIDIPMMLKELTGAARAA